MRSFKFIILLVLVLGYTSVAFSQASGEDTILAATNGYFETENYVAVL